MNKQYLSLDELEVFDSKSRLSGRERRFLCPACGQQKPRDAAHRSLAVNIETGSFICHRCQSKGRLKEFWETRPIMQKKQKTRLKLMAHFALREETFSSIEKIGGVTKNENLLEKMKLYQREFLHSPAEIYLEQRGIAVETAIRAGCGFAEKWEHWEKNDEKWVFKGSDKRVVFPIYDINGNLSAIHGRAIDENHLGSAKLTRGDKSEGLFLSDANVMDRNLLAICEGACDALALTMCGIPAVAMTGTTPPDWFYRKTAFRHILLATDADDVGDKAAYKIRDELNARGAKTFRLRPKTGKDWGEIIEKTGSGELSNCLLAFSENLSDENRAAESIKLVSAGRKEAARFSAGLIADAFLRENLLSRIEFLSKN